MTIINDIEKDREAGTPGPWSVSGPGDAGYIIATGELIAETYGVGENCDGYDADARRIARVPQLEALALKGAELEKKSKLALGAMEFMEGLGNSRAATDLRAALTAWEELTNE